MKILYYSDSTQYGGAEKYLVDMANRMSQAGAEVAVVLNSKNRKHMSLDQKIRVYEADIYASIIDYVCYPKIARIIKEYAPDIIHVNLHVVYSGLILLLLKIHARIIATIHSFKRPRSKYPFVAWYRNMMAKKMLAKYSRLIICAQSLKDQFCYEYGFSAENVDVIYNGLPDSDEPSCLGLVPCGGKPIIGVVSRMVKSKGIDTFIGSLAHLKRIGVMVKGQIVGDGPLRTYYEKMAAENGVTVEFCGYKEDPSINIKDFYVAVMPSDNENLPYVILEYMDSACPIVSTNVGGVPEMIRHGKDGLLVIPKDPIAMAVAIKQIIEDSKLSKEMGQNARMRRLEMFSDKNTVEATMAVYDKIIQYE